MPTKYESARLGEYDRRKKLNDTQRAEIIEMRNTGLSYQKIANMYGVSKTLIMLICNPDIAEKKRKQLDERHRKCRHKYSKEQWAAIMREHRAYKKKLYNEGLID